jgi:hypothetical protein
MPGSSSGGTSSRPRSTPDTLERTLQGAGGALERRDDGLQPLGFNAYFLFKVLILIFCFMVLVQAMRLLLPLVPRMASKARGARAGISTRTSAPATLDAERPEIH